MLSILGKSDLSNKIKRDLFQGEAVSILLYGCNTWTLAKRIEKKLEMEIHKNDTSYFEQLL